MLKPIRLPRSLFLSRILIPTQYCMLVLSLREFFVVLSEEIWLWNGSFVVLLNSRLCFWVGFDSKVSGKCWSEVHFQWYLVVSLDFKGFVLYILLRVCFTWGKKCRVVEECDDTKPKPDRSLKTHLSNGNLDEILAIVSTILKAFEFITLLVYLFKFFKCFPRNLLLMLESDELMEVGLWLVLKYVFSSCLIAEFFYIFQLCSRKCKNFLFCS